MPRPLVIKNIFAAVFALSSIIACADNPVAEVAGTHDSTKLAISSSGRHHADTLPSPIDVYVNDFEGVFNEQQKDSLRAQMTTISKKDSIVFCVVTVDTSMIKAENFDAFTLELANYWGVGDRNKNNGVFICFSKAGRRLRIENGNGISKIVSNAETDNVLQSVIFPAFKKGDYSGGLHDGINAMRTLINSKNKK